MSGSKSLIKFFSVLLIALTLLLMSSLTYTLVESDEAYIILNAEFIEIQPGGSFDFDAMISGVTNSNIVYEVEKNNFITVNSEGIVTADPNAEGFGELEITLTARCLINNVSAKATIIMIETPEGATSIGSSSLMSPTLGTVMFPQYTLSHF